MPAFRNFQLSKINYAQQNVCLFTPCNFPLLCLQTLAPPSDIKKTAKKINNKMLSSILKQHQEQMKGRNETQEKLKKDSVDAANELTQNLVSFN